MSDAVGRLRQLGDNATEGPWEADGWSVYTSAGALVANAEVEDWRDATSDAALIAAARNVWDALLDVAASVDHGFVMDEDGVSCCRVCEYDVDDCSCSARDLRVAQARLGEVTP